MSETAKSNSIPVSAGRVGEDGCINAALSVELSKEIVLKAKELGFKPGSHFFVRARDCGVIGVALWVFQET